MGRWPSRWSCGIEARELLLRHVRCCVSVPRSSLGTSALQLWTWAMAFGVTAAGSHTTFLLLSFDHFFMDVTQDWE